MKNLAGVASCDVTIRGELRRAGIEIIEGERSRGEVPASVTGRLGDFVFTRAWYYWVVRGPMPLEAAQRMDVTPCPTQPLRLWATYRRATKHSGGHYLVECRRFRTLYGARMAAQRLCRDHRPDIFFAAPSKRSTLKGHDVVRVAGYAGGADPEEWADEIDGVKYVTCYHVDTQEGLDLIAQTIRSLASNE